MTARLPTSNLSPATSSGPRRRSHVRHRGRRSRAGRGEHPSRAPRIALETVATLASTALVVLLPAASVQSVGPWSQPATLATCSAPGAPEVLFPSDSPRQSTGPGAIVWSSASRCPGEAAGPGPRISTIASGADAPSPASIPRTATDRALTLTGSIAAGAPHGRILLAGPGGHVGRAQTAGLLLSEGPAHGPFSAPLATGGPAAPLALTSAYLGDVALASPGGSVSAGTSAIELRVHRYYERSFLAPVPVTASRSVEGLTLAMDYRSDALAVWERDGTIYARDLPGSGRSTRSATRVASAAPGARIAALLSDDNRAILAWSETRSGVTRVYAELSSPNVRFGAPRLLERFADPGGVAPPGGSPRLVRLVSESVMLAWTGAPSGHWVVRAAAVDLHGVRSIDTISSPGHNALLAALAPGPDGEAYALWTEPQSTSSGLQESGQAVYAARGIDAYPGRIVFAAPQRISAPGARGSTGEATVAVDPDSDRAIAAWRTSAGAIDYSLRGLGGA